MRCKDPVGAISGQNNRSEPERGREKLLFVVFRNDFAVYFISLVLPPVCMGGDKYLLNFKICLQKCNNYLKCSKNKNS